MFVQANNAEESDAAIHPGMLYSKFYARRQPKSILKKTASDQKKTLKKKTRKKVVEFDTGSDTDERNRTVVNIKISLQPNMWHCTILTA